MRPKIWGAAALLALSLSGCAGWSHGGRVEYYDRYKISEQEIAEHADEVQNLLQLVQRLRPHWLDADVAYQGQVQLGTVNALSSLSADYARSLAYYDSSEAGARLPGLTGLHITGAIVVYR